MVRQSKKGELKKRKAITSTRTELTRKRAAKNSADQPDEGLLRILTGVDNDERTTQDDQGAAHRSAEDPKTIGTENLKEMKLADEGADRKASKANAPEQKLDASERPEWTKPLPDSRSEKMKVTVLLEQANLETIKQPGRTGGHVLLNSDDHRHVLKKTGRDANDARPDITHQCLMALMDSPLNKAGKLKVYIRTSKNVLIDVHPQTRVPRTFRRFSGLMAELLEKLKVRGTSGSTPLFRVIKNPITAYLPVGTRKVVCTYNTENTIDMREHAGRMSELVGKDEDSDEVNVLYVVGAMAHGKVTEDWADEYICVSEYPLSAATVCSRITYAYECLFSIL